MSNIWNPTIYNKKDHKMMSKKIHDYNKEIIELCEKYDYYIKIYKDEYNYMMNDNIHFGDFDKYYLENGCNLDNIFELKETYNNFKDFRIKYMLHKNRILLLDIIYNIERSEDYIILHKIINKLLRLNGKLCCIFTI